jgi:hypothetical protein
MWSSRGSAQTRTRRRQSVGVPPMERVAGAFIHLEASGWDSGEQDVLIGAGTERVVGSPNEEDRDSDPPNPGNDIILNESLKHSTPDGRRDFQTLLDNEVEERNGDGLGDRALLKVAGKVCVDGTVKAATALCQNSATTWLSRNVEKAPARARPSASTNEPRSDAKSRVRYPGTGQPASPWPRCVRAKG